MSESLELADRIRLHAGKDAGLLVVHVFGNDVRVVRNGAWTMKHARCVWSAHFGWSSLFRVLLSMSVISGAMAWTFLRTSLGMWQ